VGFQNPVPACSAVAAGATISEQDIAAWRNALACRIPQSTGSVTRNGNEFVFTIRWDDSQGQEPPVEFQFTTVL
jgi:hypothetical protein